MTEIINTKHFGHLNFGFVHSVEYSLFAPCGILIIYALWNTRYSPLVEYSLFIPRGLFHGVKDLDIRI